MLIAGYEARNIPNADQADVFINIHSENSLCFKGQTCKGRQKSTQRGTALFCCISEMMKLTVIGRFVKPRCLKGAGRLPYIYEANKKSWVTGAFFQ